MKSAASAKSTEFLKESSWIGELLIYLFSFPKFLSVRFFLDLAGTTCSLSSMSSHFRPEAAPPTSEKKVSTITFRLVSSFLTTVCQCVSVDTLLLWFHLVIKQLQPSVIQNSLLLSPFPFSQFPSASIFSCRCYCLMDGKHFLCRAESDWPPGSRPVFGRRLSTACPRSQD